MRRLSRRRRRTPVASVTDIPEVRDFLIELAERRPRAGDVDRLVARMRGDLRRLRKNGRAD